MSALADDLVPGQQVAALETRIAQLEAQLAEHRSPRVQILHEPLTYEARLVRDPRQKTGFRAVATRNNYSYVRDFVVAQTRTHDWMSAEARLERHANEMAKIGEAREALFHPDVDYEFEQRAVSWTSGQGGYFAPPKWLVEHFAIQPTPERVLAELVPKFELPIGAASINVPAWTLGGEVAEQALDAGGASQDITDTAQSSAVATIAGNQDVPMQLLEQSGTGAHLDWMVFKSMEARYGFRLEQQLLTGTGLASPQGTANNQLLGIFNNAAIPTANQISYTGAAEGVSTSATAMFSSLGLAVAKVGQNRLAPPEAWLMSTSRSAWLGSSEDTQARPLMIVDNATEPGVYDLLAYPVRPNDAIPRNLGTGQNEDRVIVCRPSDWLLLESERRTNVYTEVLSGNLTARIQMRRYVAAVLLYPSSVAYLYGSGMATGGGF